MCSYDGKLYAINPNGTEKWTFETGDVISSSPAIGPDGIIYVGSRNENLYAINPDGTQKWAFKAGDYITSSPAIGADGTIYFGSNDTNLYAINSDETEKWTIGLGNNFAHEIFHLITWYSFPPNLIEKAPDLWNKLEKIANVFASCILLPSDVVTVEFEKNIDKNSIAYIDLIGMARKFDVSTEALLFRLLNLKLLDKNTVDNILKDQLFRETDKSTMAPRWWRPPEFPERFVRLAFVAYKKGRLSKAKLANLLDTSLFDLSEILREYGLIDREGYNVEVRVA